VKANEGRN